MAWHGQTWSIHGTWRRQHDGRMYRYISPSGVLLQMVRSKGQKRGGKKFIGQGQRAWFEETKKNNSMTGGPPAAPRPTRSHGGTGSVPCHVPRCNQVHPAKNRRYTHALALAFFSFSFFHSFIHPSNPFIDSFIRPDPPSGCFSMAAVAASPPPPPPPPPPPLGPRYDTACNRPPQPFPTLPFPSLPFPSAGRVQERGACQISPPGPCDSTPRTTATTLQTAPVLSSSDR